MPHIHEKIDFTSEVFVVHKNRVLLRMHDKYKIWLSVGGHVELDEDPTQAAIREVKEEVGLDIKLVGTVPTYEKVYDNFYELIPPRFMNRHKITDIHQHVTMIWFATCENDQVQAGGHDKSEDWKWFTKEELDDPNFGVNANIRCYAKAALEELAE